MSFELEELEEIISSVKQRIYILNATEPDSLIGLLKEFGVSCKATQKIDAVSADTDSYSDGLILIAGDSQVKRNNLEGMIKEKFPMLKGRVRFALDYDALKNYQNPSKYEYAALLLGPAPHKIAGMGDASSMIERLIKNEDGYFPPSYVLSANSDIKISKSNVENKINELMCKGVIR